MKSCASGLGERLFKVMIAIGIRVLGNSSRTLSTARLRGSLAKPALWGTFTSYSLPAFLAHSTDAVMLYRARG
jgi:hypothetical protein